MNRRREEHKRPENHQEILEYYGEEHQILKAAEEFGEASTALLRYGNMLLAKPGLYSVAEIMKAAKDAKFEMADALNTAEQIYLKLGTVEEEREQKMCRTLARIAKGEG